MIKCFDAAQMYFEMMGNSLLINKQFNEFKMKAFHNSCDVIDSLLFRFGGDQLDIDVDSQTYDITVAIECEDLEVLSSSDEFYSVIGQTIRFSLEPAQEIECGVRIKLVFCSVWG